MSRPAGAADLDQLVERQETLREHVSRAELDWGERAHPLVREVIVAETDERVSDLVENHLARTYADEYGSSEWSHPLIEDEAADDSWGLAEDCFLVGTPAEIAGQLDTFRDRLALDHVGCRFHHPGMSHEQVRRQIELFGDEVIPAV